MYGSIIDEIVATTALFIVAYRYEILRKNHTCKNNEDEYACHARFVNKMLYEYIIIWANTLNCEQAYFTSLYDTPVTSRNWFVYSVKSNTFDHIVQRSIQLLKLI